MGQGKDRKDNENLCHIAQYDSRKRTTRIAQIDTSEFETGESSRSSKVKRRESIHVDNMLGIRREVRDTELLCELA